MNPSTKTAMLNTRKLLMRFPKLKRKKHFFSTNKKEARTALNLLRENKEPLTEFDEAIFFSLVENIVVKSKDTLVFNFKDGTEIEWRI